MTREDQEWTPTTGLGTYVAWLGPDSWKGRVDESKAGTMVEPIGQVLAYAVTWEHHRNGLRLLSAGLVWEAQTVKSRQSEHFGRILHFAPAVGAQSNEN